MMSDGAEIKSAGGIAPFGYRWQNGRLVVNEMEAPVRKLIYELFLKHRRKKTVARILNDEGYRTRSGAKFSDTTIDRLIRDGTAKGTRFADGKEIIVEPIVSLEVWERANNHLGTKQFKQAVQLFAGIAFCRCGGKMIVPSGGSSKYTCLECRHKIGTDDLEEIFASQLTGFIVPVEKDGQTEEVNLSDIWRHLDSKEKRILVEQILHKIVVGKTEIEIEFGLAPDSFKTAALGQQMTRGNETPNSGVASPPQDGAPVIINEPLMNEVEAAKFLGISRMTLLRKRNAREIGFFRVGFRILYSKEKHLMPYLESCER